MSAANAALAGLYQAHASELHGFARRRVGRQEAEDVVQDAYLHLLQRGTAATSNSARLSLSHCANLAVDFARKAKIRLRHAGEAFDLGANAVAPANPEASRAPRWSLPGCMTPSPICRRSAVMPFCSIDRGLTHAEIAGRLGVSVRTIDRFMVKHGPCARPFWNRIRGLRRVDRRNR